ncbi:acetate--CoA ligase [Flammeovirga kamogawensis]|uniref:Acetate--CoA ligase n=1 Tax=Flammeovirga kamogawensis TaxID=373891 RepID=A0ABX8GVK2_9BACT|nr:acetate--CoA ligase [Flammeovirga kamogawensis]MBB6461050.1 acetyl-CoA synthetase [Flammeovirga kamogawensis]QWG07620.1 acetate--CoA ligase [Flammeovirga kamogawensis]TRX69430.1 acetate--CoA ligase [Flammeovirga kamogawensis]
MISRINNLEDYAVAYRRSVSEPERFWSEVAEQFVWRKKWDKTVEYDFDNYNVQWYRNGKLNITENCLDRHLLSKGDKTAIHWVANDPHEKDRIFSYKELHEQVSLFANVLKRNGVGKGDRVCLYMPMVPELAIAVLACARIGAIHSVIFGGFSAQALADRINDAGAKILITADQGPRGKKVVELKAIADEALFKCENVERVIVYQRTGADVKMDAERDVYWHDEIKSVPNVCEPEVMDSEDPLFILYTSGSTGKPKGVVHSTGGYMVYTWYSFRNVFQYQENDVYWCTADIGWITGHSYIVYGPLLEGATSVMFEGVPTFPDAGRFWRVVDRLKVNIFYTAPTAIRALMAQGLEYVELYKLDSLRVLGTVGEPINREAWEWYHQHIGKGRCPIVDTWWQTETGGIMISPIAGVIPTKPTYATLPLPGIQPVLVDPEGNEIEGKGVEGNLCVKYPWPSMLRTTWGDHERCKQTYFSTFKGLYFTGDGCRRDEDGYYRILGRVDDVMNVSGHRLGTAEVENAINMHSAVIESAVVGYPHDIKGQGIYAYVVCDSAELEVSTILELKEQILEVVIDKIGKIARPDKVQIVRGLPKTRSGKIMRRILRKIGEGQTDNFGDISTLLDPSIVEAIKEGAVKDNAINA